MMRRLHVFIIVLSAVAVCMADPLIFHRARKCFTDRDFNSAKSLFTQILDTDPDNGEANLYLGKMESSAAAAQPLFQKAANSKDTAISRCAELLLGKYFLSQGAYDDAAAHLLKAAGDNPKSKYGMEIAANLAHAYTGGKNPDEEERLYNNMILNTSDSASRGFAYAGLGIMSFRHKEFAEATEFFERALRFRKNSLDYLMLFTLCDIQNDTAGACTYYSKLEKEFGASLDFETVKGKYAYARQEEKKLAAPVEENKKSVFWVQAGAFSNVENAKRFKADMEKQVVLPGGADFVIQESGKMQAVRIGPFEDEKSAIDWADNEIAPLNFKYRVLDIP